MADLGNPLDAYLGAKQAEGRYFDTAGFTIDSVKAMQKLSRHQLPDSGLWLVKIVQAAVAGGAEGIEVTFERKRVKVHFRPSAQWQADEILEAVLSGAIPRDTATMHLVTAIRASSGSVTETVSWSCGTARVSLDSRSCQVVDIPSTPEFSLEATRPTRSRSLATTLTSPVTQLAKQTVEENDALHSRCWVCPIPITVDGEPLPRGYDQVEGGQPKTGKALPVLGRFNKGGQYQMLSCLAIRPVEQPDLGPTIPYHLAETPQSDRTVAIAKPVYRKQTFLTVQSSGTPNAALALVSGPQADKPTISFVLDGAVVATAPIDLWRLPADSFLGVSLASKRCIGARVVVGVTPEDLDLSHFAVREPRVEHYARRLAPPMLEMLEQLERRLGDLYYLPVSRKSAPWAGAGLGGHLLLLTALSQGLAFLPMAGMIAGFSVANLARWRSQARKALEQLKARLEEKG